MALIKCEECEKEYSDKATECPNCGCPTISNTISEKRKDIKPCSVEIKGNEKYYLPIALRAVVISILYIIIGVFSEEYLPGSGWIFIVGGIGLVGLSMWIAKKLPGYKKEKRDREIINEYFHSRFPILTTMPQNYKEIKVATKATYYQIGTMFEIFMEAYKFNADCIVVTNSNVSTHISGSTSKSGKGTTHSHSKFHTTATLVKY